MLCLGFETPCLVWRRHHLLCRYAQYGQELGNSWRVGYDVNTWSGIYGNAISVNSKLAQYAGPGGFNDVDALIGSSPHAAVSVTQTQSRTQFSMYVWRALIGMWEHRCQWIGASGLQFCWLVLITWLGGGGLYYADGLNFRRCHTLNTCIAGGQ